jgi:hypothetical protein
MLDENSNKTQYQVSPHAQLPVRRKLGALSTDIEIAKASEAPEPPPHPGKIDDASPPPRQPLPQRQD